MRDFSREIAEDDAAFEHLEVITADDVNGEPEIAEAEEDAGTVVQAAKLIVSATVSMVFDAQ